MYWSKYFSGYCPSSNDLRRLLSIIIPMGFSTLHTVLQHRYYCDMWDPQYSFMLWWMYSSRDCIKSLWTTYMSYTLSYCDSLLRSASACFVNVSYHSYVKFIKAISLSAIMWSLPWIFRSYLSALQWSLLYPPSLSHALSTLWLCRRWEWQLEIGS